jgi:hypothetical protein
VTRDPQLENRILWLVRIMVVAAAVSLAAGLAVYVLAPESPAAAPLLRTGLMLLMGTPVLRMFIALSLRILDRDFQFLAVTAVVMLELSLTLWYATTRV